jgi:hypothetical protein
MTVDQIALAIGFVVMYIAAASILAIILVLVAATAVVVWRCIIWRKPHHILRISTIDRFVTTGEGKPVKRAADLDVAGAYGFGWKRKFLFGLFVFEDDRP